MDIKAIRQEIENDLETFVWQYRFFKEVSKDLNTRIKLVSESDDAQHEKNLREYIDKEIKFKLAQVNQSLVEIQNRTKTIENTFQAESTNSDAHNLKEYAKSLNTIHKHFHDSIERQVESDFLAMQSLIEVLRLATEVPDKKKLLEESTKAFKLIKRILFVLRWYVFRAYRLVLDKDFKKFTYLENHVEHKDLNANTDSTDKALVLTNFFADFCNTVFYNRDNVVQTKSLYDEIAWVLDGGSGGGSYMAHTHSTQKHEFLFLELTDDEKNYIKSKCSHDFKEIGMTPQERQFLSSYEKRIVDIFIEKFRTSGQDPFTQWSFFVKFIKLSQNKSALDIISGYKTSRLNNLRTISKISYHNENPAYAFVINSVIKDIQLAIAADKLIKKLPSLTDWEVASLNYVVSRILNCTLQGVIAIKMVKFLTIK